MLLKLILLFSIVPLVELALLIQIGRQAGVIFTIVLVGITGVIGVSLARSQGFKTVGRIKNNLNQGHLPADDLLGGLLILGGALFLLTPGLLTDIAGFLLVIPYSRKFFVKIVKRKLGHHIKDNFHSQYFSFSTEDFSDDFDSQQNKNEPEEVVDVDFTEINTDRENLSNKE